MLKKTVLFLLTFFLFFLITPSVKAETTVNTYLFYGDGCPHCAKEREFLAQLRDKYSQVQVNEYEIYYNLKNNLLLQKVASALKADAGGVPFLVIGDKYYIGFLEGISPGEIEKRINECLENKCDDVVAAVIAQQENNPAEPKENQTTDNNKTGTKTVNIPILGQVDISQLSLPVLTFILALLDGFNPCAMWTLIFLISLLLGLNDRKRMWILGSAFIITSAVVYFLFLSAWLNLFLFLGFVIWVRILIGIFALGAGGYYLRDYWVNKTAACKVTGSEKRQKVFEKLKEITQSRQFLLALGGIILLAAAVNMVELICSAGLPAIYTQILSLSNLPRWKYYLYLIFYILIFMLDDLIVFFTAMITLKATGIQTKYSRYSHLIGGILMFIIGLLLLFKPEWLMFG
jgi:glutaredoxin